MITILLEESAAGPAKVANVSERTLLMDLCDELRAPVRFSCRAARCATCRVHVQEGGSLLSPPGAEEAELLSTWGNEEGVRLACQAVIEAGAGRVRLRWLGPAQR